MSDPPEIPPEHPLWELHRGLPRQAPGSRQTTSRMLRVALERGGMRRAIDVGAGPGSSALVLAEAGLDVVALDVSQVLLDELASRAASAGLSGRIRRCRASMDAIPFAHGDFDLVWSEGAAYFMGFGAALREWRGLLRAGGVLAVTELCWLTERPSEEASGFFAAEYPAMATADRTRAEAESAGYRILASFELPEADWWEYYGPLEERIERLRPRAEGELSELLELAQQEIDVRRRRRNRSRARARTCS